MLQLSMQPMKRGSRAGTTSRRVIKMVVMMQMIKVRVKLTEAAIIIRLVMSTITQIDEAQELCIECAKDMSVAVEVMCPVVAAMVLILLAVEEVVTTSKSAGPVAMILTLGQGEALQLNTLQELIDAVSVLCIRFTRGRVAVLLLLVRQRRL